MTFPGTSAWSTQKAYEMASLESALRIRLRDVVREALGGTYGVRVKAELSRSPKGSQIDIMFGCDPAKADQLAEVVLNELEEVKKTGFKAGTVIKVRNTQRTSWDEDLRTNSFGKTPSKRV